MSSAVNILNLLVGHDDGTVRTYFGVEHEGGLWLVTAWLIDQATGVATPERMIRLDTLDRPPTAADPGSPFDYEVQLLPIAVVEGLSQDMPGYEVRSLPSSPIVHRGDLKMLPLLFP